MTDGAIRQAVPVTPDATAASPAVRAAMRIALRNGCALSRDAAEQIAEAVLGCAGRTVTEWGALRPDLASGVLNAGSGDEAEKMARLIAGDQERRGIGKALVRRTVTYGPWEAPGE